MRVQEVRVTFSVAAMIPISGVASDHLRALEEKKRRIIFIRCIF